MSLKLYFDPLSPLCRSVQILLGKAGVEHEAVELQIIRGDLKQDNFLSKFPIGLVPTVEEGGLLLAEW